jgi:hypothetical protein
MSGTIEICAGTRWSAASWLFDWTVGFLADSVSDPYLAGRLREIVCGNLGWLGLDDYGPQARTELVAIISSQIAAAASSLPLYAPATIDHASRIQLLGELAVLVTASLDGCPEPYHDQQLDSIATLKPQTGC